MTLAEDNTVDTVHLAVADAQVACQWKYDEKSRQRRRQKLARLKEQQRIAGTTKWARGNSNNSAQTQVAVKRAVRDWFNAVRGDDEGIAIPVLVDAVVMLGLNNDFKQVQRTASSDAHDHVGGQLTLKGFTTALLACCSSPNQRDRLFRALRGKGEGWRRYGGAGKHENGGNELSPAGSTSVPTGVPTFVTQLAAYRRKVLMATVADRFPTPCTSTFWTPDCEKHLETRDSTRERGVKVTRPTENSSKQIRPLPRAEESPAARPGTTCTPDGTVVHPCAGNIIDEKNLPTMPSNPPESGIGVSVETRRRYDAILEGIFLSSASTPTSDSPGRGIHTTSAASTQKQMRSKHKTPPHGPPVAPGGTSRGQGRIPKHAATTICRNKQVVGQGRETRRSGSSRPSLTGESVQGACVTDVSSRERSNSSTPLREQCDSGRGMDGVPESCRLIGDSGSAEEGIRETAGRLRDSMLQTERSLVKSEARWVDYQVMKKRWRRRTPLGILTDDELDEDNRNYSRLSRPRTNQGTGGGSRGKTSGTADAGSTSKQSCSRQCTGSSICRPSTAPACSRADLGLGSSVTGLTTITSNNSSKCRMRPRIHREGGEGGRVMPKPLPLGPIALDGSSHKLRYPFLQLKETARAARVGSGNPGVWGDGTLCSSGGSINKALRHGGGLGGL